MEEYRAISTNADPKYMQFLLAAVINTSHPELRKQFSDSDDAIYF